MASLKVTKIGNSTGIILTKEVLAKLDVQPGDTVYVTDTANGIALTAYDPEFDHQMTVARKVMREWREALRELAK